MNAIARIVIALVVTTGFTACLAEQETVGTRQMISVWDIAPDANIGAPITSVPTGEDVALVDYSADEPDICACDGPECELAAVEQSFGCGVCVAVPCGDRYAGGCVPCPDEIGALVSAATERTWE